MNPDQAAELAAHEPAEPRRHHVELRVPDPENPRGYGRIALNDVPVGHSVRGVTFDLDCRDRAPEVTLELAIRTFDVDLDDAHVTVDNEQHDLLVALGWTPPGGAS